MTPSLHDLHVTLLVLDGWKVDAVAADVRCSSSGVSRVVHRTILKVFGSRVFPRSVRYKVPWLRCNKDRFIPRLRELTGE